MIVVVRNLYMLGERYSYTQILPFRKWRIAVHVSNERSGAGVLDVRKVGLSLVMAVLVSWCGF